MNRFSRLAINRQSFSDDLQLFIQQHRDEEKSFALLAIKINHFRQFNIAHGYSYGDEILKQFADRLNDVSRDQDYIARTGSAEFVLILPEVFNEGHATLAAIKLINAIAEPFLIGKEKFSLSSFVGIVLYPEHASEGGELLQKAEIALTDARKESQCYSIFTEQSQQLSTDSWNIESELQNAIENDEFELYFQPQVYLKSGQLFGAEALIRWKNGERGFIRPDIFIPIAEQSGQIYDITIWTINAALWAIREWPKMQTPLKVSVNLSTKMLGEPGLIKSITNAISLYGLNFEQLTLEITESALVEDMSSSFKTLDELKSLGLNISIDDFGTGYSSMAYFKNIPADELKIDQVFIRYMLKNSMDQHIVKTVIAMAQGFHLDVVAEGIEDKETFEFLRHLGCDIAQGYYLAKPMPQPEFINWLEKYTAKNKI